MRQNKGSYLIGNSVIYTTIIMVVNWRKVFNV